MKDFIPWLFEITIRPPALDLKYTLKAEVFLNDYGLDEMVH